MKQLEYLDRMLQYFITGYSWLVFLAVLWYSLFQTPGSRETTWKQSFLWRNNNMMTKTRFQTTNLGCAHPNGGQSQQLWFCRKKVLFYCSLLLILLIALNIWFHVTITFMGCTTNTLVLVWSSSSTLKQLTSINNKAFYGFIYAIKYATNVCIQAVFFWGKTNVVVADTYFFLNKGNGSLRGRRSKGKGENPCARQRKGCTREWRHCRCSLPPSSRACHILAHLDFPPSPLNACHVG